ncbi:MAG: hypothetical protein ACUVQ6_07580 [Dissulfurimicrobium sp.]|uniref:hypothetical protein n=1 Tax=Dissulfurimicrobium sp. TaxID=2022436 RepID=UPI00404958F9
MHEGLLREQNHILVVYDDNAILCLLEGFLGENGFTYRLASDGFQAMSLMEKGPSTINYC